MWVKTPATFPTKLRRPYKLGSDCPSMPSDSGLVHGDEWGCGWLVPQQGRGGAGKLFVAQVALLSQVTEGGGGVCSR